VGTLTTWIDDERREKTIANLPGGYPRFYEAVRDAILKGEPNPVPPEDGVAVMRVIEAGIRSAEECRCKASTPTPPAPSNFR
jgi:predicted dehydrogenase